MATIYLSAGVLSDGSQVSGIFTRRQAFLYSITRTDLAARGPPLTPSPVKRDDGHGLGETCAPTFLILVHLLQKRVEDAPVASTFGQRRRVYCRFNARSVGVQRKFLMGRDQTLRQSVARLHDPRCAKETASLHFTMSDKDAPHFQRQATGGALFDKIESDRGRSVRCPIRISVRRGEYPPRFRSSRCMMLARCRAPRASASLYPIASYGEISVCIPLSLSSDGPSLLLGTGANNIRRHARCRSLFAQRVESANCSLFRDGMCRRPLAHGLGALGLPLVARAKPLSILLCGLPLALVQGAVARRNDHREQEAEPQAGRDARTCIPPGDGPRSWRDRGGDSITRKKKATLLRAAKVPELGGNLLCYPNG
jgi:hypothetical protein